MGRMGAGLEKLTPPIGVQPQDIWFPCSDFVPGRQPGKIQNDRNLVEEGRRLFRSQFEIAGLTNFCKSGMHSVK